MAARRSTQGARRTGKRAIKAGTSKRAAAQRRTLFVEAMLANGGNATEAAIAAGFSRRSARSRGHELVKDRDVAAELERRRAETKDSATLTAEEVRIDLARGLRFDPRRLYDQAGTLKPVAEWPDDIAPFIEAIESEEITVGRGGSRKVVGRVVKIKFARKSAVREQAMKYFGMFKRDNEQKANPLEALLQWVRENNAASGTHGLPINAKGTSHEGRDGPKKSDREESQA